MRVVVLGAGSIGCFVGGAWKTAGVPVEFIGRAAIGSDIAANGLKLSDQDGWERTFSPGGVDYSVDPAALASADLIALCVKSGATADAAALIRDHARPGATVLSLQNGISNIDALKAQLGNSFSVVRGSVPYNVAYLGKGHFHKGVAGQLLAEDVPMLHDLAQQVRSSPAVVTLSNDMVGVAWGKLLINLNNAVNALSGRTLVDQLSQRDYRRVVASSMREGLALLHMAGIRPAKAGLLPPRLLPTVMQSPDWLFNRLFLKLQRIDAHARSSMADDLARGRRTEIDYLNGELLMLADRLGVAAPINRRVVSLVRDAEDGGRRNWSPADLRAAILG
nr:2-dehydropantoate 2-reductase [uncultured Sphingomonas sp.]